MDLGPSERRQQWILDRATAVARAQELIAELAGERDRLLASIPLDVTNQLARVRHQITQVEADRVNPYCGPVRGSTPPSATPTKHFTTPNAPRAHDPTLD